MNNTVSQQGQVIRRIASRIRQIVAECNDATRRMTTLAGTPDRFPADPDRAPDSYGEFLIRTAGLMRREPASDATRGASACC
ncbi:MAG: hypothetical protein WBH47_17935 [Streptosporangiaceae bacterium]